jgi:hypothetical protein
MNIPNMGRAVASYEKIAGYLLNPQHPEGGDNCIPVERLKPMIKNMTG